MKRRTLIHVSAKACSIASVLLLATAIAGCKAPGTSQATTLDAAGEARQQTQAVEKKMNAARQALEQIPPPAKSRYMSIHTPESWGNPFLIVGDSTVTLRVMYPDETQSSALPSAMLKPAKARRQELQLRLSDLPDALGALPEEEWPYGRVIAVEEDPAETKADRRQVRQNVEAAVQMLNNLGVVINEWPVTGLPR